MLVSLSGVLALVALAYSLLLASKLLVQSGGDRIANTFLATVCLCLAAWSWGFLARDAALYSRFPHLAYVVTPVLFLLGPALLAYTKRITSGINLFRSLRAALHLLPAMLFVVAATPFYRLDAFEKEQILPGASVASAMTIMLALVVPHIVSYSLACLKPIQRYEAMAVQHFSDLEHGNIRWLKRLCGGMLLLLMFDLLLPGVATWLSFDEAPVLTIVVRLCLLLYVVFVAYSALGHPPFLYREMQAAPDDSATSSQPTTEQNEIEKYARSGLREDSARYYLSKLEALMRENHAYLDSSLTLRSLADKMKLRPHHVSQILNGQLNKTFHDYINEYRVQHAKKLLTRDPGNLSIIEIAFESGYNNKVSFYNAFKRIVGMTPTQFKEASGKSGSA